MAGSFSLYTHIYLSPRITNEQGYLNNWVLYRSARWECSSKVRACVLVYEWVHACQWWQCMQLLYKPAYQILVQ